MPNQYQLETLPLPAHLQSPQRLLAIDTSLGSSVAVNDGTHVYCYTNADPLGHAESIDGLLRDVLTAANLTPAAFTGVVMGVGPGSFTGLRVGMAAAIAFATARELPLLPVCSHDAHALTAQRTGRYPDGTRLQIIQDARRKELFISEYLLGSADSIPVQCATPRVVARQTHTPAPVNTQVTLLQASNLVLTALHKSANGQDFLPPQPLYLRDPDVRKPLGVQSVVDG